MNNDHAPPRTTSVRTVHRPLGDAAPESARNVSPQLVGARREELLDQMASLTPVPHWWHDGENVDQRYDALLKERLDNITLAEIVDIDRRLRERRENATGYSFEYDALDYERLRS